MLDDIDTVSELLKHARQTSFALVATSFIVFSTFVFNPVKNTDLAISEFTVVQQLVNHWNAHTAASAPFGLPALRVFKSPVLSSSDFYVVDVANSTLTDVTLFKGKEVTQSALNCNLRNLELTPEFLLLKSGDVIRMETNPSWDFEDLTSEKDQRILNSVVLGDMKDIQDFVLLWNLLSDSIGTVEISGIEARELIGYSYIYDNDDKVVEAEYYKHVFSDISLESRRRSEGDYAIRNSLLHDNERYQEGYLFPKDIKEINPEDGFLDALPNTDYLVEINCYVEHENLLDSDAGVIPEDRATFLSPIVTTKHVNNLQRSWLTAASNSGYVDKSLPEIRTGRFKESFANLDSLISRLGNKPISDLAEDLKEFRRDEVKGQAQQIQFMGISLNPLAVRSLGIFLIVLLQGYLSIHMREANRRVKLGVTDIDAAFLPWVALYDNCVAHVVYLSMIVLLPLLAILSLIYWSMQSADGLLGWISLILSGLVGVLLSIFISLRIREYTTNLIRGLSEIRNNVSS